MVPSEYRLEQVTARLAERLEGTRRSFAGQPERAAEAFRGIAQVLVNDVVAEFRADGFTDSPDRHEVLLRSEVLDTFLPRYTRLATAMTEREENGYGVGFLYGPVGRVILFVVVLFITAMLLRMPGAWTTKLVPILPLIVGIFVPDLLGWAARRRYRTQLLDALEDMRVIQDRAGDYVSLPADITDEVESDLARLRKAQSTKIGS
jgi:hypothetical protein